MPVWGLKGIEISDLRFQISDFRSETGVCRLHVLVTLQALALLDYRSRLIGQSIGRHPHPFLRLDPGKDVQYD